MEALFGPVSKWFFGDEQNSAQVTVVSDKSIDQSSPSSLSSEKHEQCDQTHEPIQYDIMVKVKSPSSQSSPVLQQTTDFSAEDIPNALDEHSNVQPETNLQFKDKDNAAFNIAQTSTIDITEEHNKRTETSQSHDEGHQDTTHNVQDTSGAVNTNSEKEETNIPSLSQITNLKVAAIRAFGWIFNSSNPNNSDHNDGNSETTSDQNIADENKRNKSKHKKPLPPRPKISRTRLKVFVGTWNMMGQMPNEKDGLSGFIDIQPTHSCESTNNQESSIHSATPTSATSVSNSNLEDPKSTSQKRPANNLFGKPRIKSPLKRNGGPKSQFNPDSSSSVLNEPFLEMSAGAPYHIIAINTQECEREIREAVLFPSKVAWENHLQTSLGPDYVMIKTETMAALHIAIFVWRPIAHLVSAVDSSTVATGIGGIVGNKGAVAISVYLGSTSFLFVNAHLTAHQSNTHARNSDYKRIIQELQLNDSPKNLPGRWYFKGDMQLRRHYNSQMPLVPQKSFHAPSGTHSNTESSNNLEKAVPVNDAHKKSDKAKAERSESKIMTIGKSHGHKNGQIKDGDDSTAAGSDITEQFDYTFWAGDLNYRVNLSRAEAEECIEKGDLETLLAKDQLTAQREAGNVFNGFTEAPIRFKPTYKFDPIHFLPESKQRRARQKTLLGRPKSMINFSEYVSAGHGYPVSRLENNLSCPSLVPEHTFEPLSKATIGLDIHSGANIDSEHISNAKHISNGNHEKHSYEMMHSSSPVISHSEANQHGQVSDKSLGNYDSSNQKVEKANSPSVSIDLTDTRSKRDVLTSNDPHLINGDGSQSQKDEVKCEQDSERQKLLDQVRYDTSSKQRVPSWTDRILWKSTGGNLYLPSEIGDDTRSGGGGGSQLNGKRGWALLRKNRAKIVSANGKTQRLDEGSNSERPNGNDAISESSPRLSSSESSPVMLKLGRKIVKDSKEENNDGKSGKLGSLNFRLTGPKKRRYTGSRLMSIEDEDRAAVIVKEYTAHHDIGLFSDHRPVTAVFAVRFDWNLTPVGGMRGVDGVVGGDGLNRWVPLDVTLAKM